MYCSQPVDFGPKLNREASQSSSVCEPAESKLIAGRGLSGGFGQRLAREKLAQARELEEVFRRTEETVKDEDQSDYLSVSLIL